MGVHPALAGCEVNLNFKTCGNLECSPLGGPIKLKLGNPKYND